MDTINSQLDGIATYKISSEGKDIGNKFGLLSFKISREINKIGKALMVFEAGDMTKGALPESDEAVFDIGKSIKIEAGYGNRLKPVFEGIVVGHSPNIAAENNTTLQVECKEMPFKATLEAKNAIFGEKSKVTDEKIIKEVLQPYGLSLQVSGAGIEHLQYSQKYKSDWETALKRATANGLVTIVNGKSVSIKPPVTAKQDAELEYGTNIIEFDARLNVANLYEKVTVESVALSEEQGVKAEATVDYGNQPGSAADKPLNKNYLIKVTDNTGKDSLLKIAKAIALQIGMAKITGSCKFCGKAEIEIGKPIALKGFGKRFTGNAYVSGLEHDFGEDGWTTTVKFGFPFENSGMKSTSVAQMKSNSNYTNAMENSTENVGLQTAIVTQLTGDPGKEYRIEVKMPDSSGKEKKLWARLANFWGNKSYGSFFIPEKGDEVIIGFFNNDPAHPVILGTLYSSKNPPPNELKDENSIQSITTKSKITLEFDDEKKVITLQTPGKNIIKISDEGKGISLSDQNKNKIEMNDSGIVIQSAKSITLKAQTGIKMEAGMSLEAKAKTDLKLQGMNVEGKAQMSMKMTGAASAEISASGTTTVKGAMVMIN